MRKYLLAAVAAAALTSTPALARDHSFYIGAEGGVIFGAEADVDIEFDDGFDRFRIRMTRLKSTTTWAWILT